MTAEQEWPEMQCAEFSTPADAKLAKKLASEVQNMWRIERDKLAAQLAEKEREIASINELLTSNGVGFDPDNLKSLSGRIQMLLNWKNSTEYAATCQSRRAEAAEQRLQEAQADIKELEQ